MIIAGAWQILKSKDRPAAARARMSCTCDIQQYERTFHHKHRWFTAQNGNITSWACIHNTITGCKHENPLSLSGGGVPELVCAVRPFECAGAGLTRALAAVNRAVPLQHSRARIVATAWAWQNSLLCSTHLEVSYSIEPQNNNSEINNIIVRRYYPKCIRLVTFPLFALVCIFIVACDSYCVLANL